jgi:D-inositol-3-phosphate glycosyltransferase
LAADLGLASHVLLPGPLPRGALPLYYRAAAVCAVPSHYESFGLTALEALACGTPVVASRVGGLQLTVHDGMNGYLVAPGDPAALAARLGAVLAGDETRARLGAAAALSAEPYAWATVAERMLCLYTSLGIGYHPLWGRAAPTQPRLLTGTAR